MILTYTSLEGQNIFDLSLAIYKNVQGVANLLSFNPSLDPNSTTSKGTPIFYDNTVRFSLPQFTGSVATKNLNPNPFKVVNQMTVFDLAIQLYGRVDAINGFIGSIVTDINSAVPLVSIPPVNSQNYFVKNVFSKVIVATMPNPVVTAGPAPQLKFNLNTNSQYLILI